MISITKLKFDYFERCNVRTGLKFSFYIDLGLLQASQRFSAHHTGYTNGVKYLHSPSSFSDHFCARTGMAGPSAGGIDATQAGPAGGANASEAGASAGNRVPPGAGAPAAFPQSHVNLREQDLLMPVATVIRIMRRVLPKNAKVSDDAREMIQECVSEYINLITAEANERCKLEKRKTITADDVISAMGRLGFDSYVGPLRLYLRRYREMESHQRIGLRGEHFPVITNRSHLPIGDTNRTPPLIAQPLLMRSPQPPPPQPPPPPSSLVLQPTVPPPRVDDLLGEAPGADYFLGMSGGGDGSGTSSSEAPPMPDFFP